MCGADCFQTVKSKTLFSQEIFQHMKQIKPELAQEVLLQTLGLLGASQTTGPTKSDRRGLATRPLPSGSTWPWTGNFTLPNLHVLLSEMRNNTVSLAG